ncbi:hypothetical protein GH975_08015 [Litorivicinus lipolyticus]|uniref:Uncharacterized protein n=1 Tax=Litorivicinus lipolyticus TaxID=418701 RepID=A0A5Q2QET5_9GAMM|nr:hypothetical protein [Litorivicinus lipolyticus]QGG80517.1 hypothetical protein GH975_08015 [Litorivicinus lipolyticus]
MRAELARCVAALPNGLNGLTWTQPDAGVAAAWAATQHSLPPPAWLSVDNGWAHAHCWLTQQAVDGGWFWLISTLEGL